MITQIESTDGIKKIRLVHAQCYGEVQMYHLPGRGKKIFTLEEAREQMESNHKNWYKVRARK